MHAIREDIAPPAPTSRVRAPKYDWDAMKTNISSFEVEVTKEEMRKKRISMANSFRGRCASRYDAGERLVIQERDAGEGKAGLRVWVVKR